jgi:hypothetical protein
MKKLIATASLVSIFCFSAIAHAGLLIEPFMAYETGKFKSPGVERDATGSSFGARLGYSTLGLSVYGEYNAANMNVKASSGPDTSVSANDLGVGIGYSFPIMFQAYLSYFIDSKASWTGTEVKGNGGTRIGVGFTGFPFVVINLEMIAKKYNKSTSGGVETSQNTDFTTTAISVSLPFVF